MNLLDAVGLTAQQGLFAAAGALLTAFGLAAFAFARRARGASRTLLELDKG